MGEDSHLDSYWEDQYELSHYQQPEDEGDPFGADEDSEWGFPYDVHDLSDDADALASVWGPEEDYGGYWEE